MLRLRTQPFRAEAVSEDVPGIALEWGAAAPAQAVSLGFGGGFYASCGCAGCGAIKTAFVAPLSGPDHARADEAAISWVFEDAAATVSLLLDAVAPTSDLPLLYQADAAVLLFQENVAALLAELGLAEIQLRAWDPGIGQLRIGGPDIPGGVTTDAVLALGASANGSIQVAGDNDWFRVELTQGQTYQFILNALGGAGVGLSDPYLELYNSTAQLLATDDDSGPGVNALLQFTATQSGVYFINARGFGTATGDYTLAFTTPAAQNPLEGADIPGDATTNAVLSLGSAANGSILPSSDEDWYRVQLTAGESYVFTLDAFDGRGTGLSDAYLELFSSTGQLLSLDDDTGPSLNSLLRFTAVQSGVYYINARAFDTETGDYTISFNTGAPQNPLDTINLGFVLTNPNVTYYFAQGGDTHPAGNGQTAQRSWTAEEQNAARAAFATFSAVCGLTFTEVATQAAASFVMMISELEGSTLGRFFAGASGGLGQFDPGGAGWTSSGLQPGGLGFVTLIHEIGHGVGLAHPHDAGGGSQVMQGVVDEFNSLGTFNLNQGVFTTMTYNDGWVSAPHGATPSTSFGAQATPMGLDIGLLQQRYGANTSANSGNTEYVLPSLSAAGVGYRAIWDVGGTDTIRHNGVGGATIDLRPATLLNAVAGGGHVSFVAGVHGGFTIAATVIIENAIGGPGLDTLIGNSVANLLDGGPAADSLDGGEGADTLIGGAGGDSLIGGAGFDTVSYAGSAFGVLVNLSNPIANVGDAEGDTYSSIEAVIGTDAVDSLTGTGAGDFFTGGGGNDLLAGGGGIDTALYGVASNVATFIRSASGGWTVSTGAEGTDTLTGMELLQFSNRTFALRPAEGSIDGNATSDIILRNANGTIALWTMNGASVTGAQIVAASDPNFSALGQGDFDGDGRFDVLFRNAGGILAQWQMNGATVSAVGAYVTDPNWSVAAIGDFNGDFRDDILWRNSSGLLAQWQMNGLAASAVGVFAASDPSWSIVAAADFNGDGKDDLLWRNASGLLALWQMDGFTVASAGVIAASDPTWQIVGTGDFNGDLREDILWRSSGGVLAQWTMDGGSVLSAGAFAVSDLAWSVSDIGDYNGDGRDDILWQGPDGTLALWTLDGFAVASAGIIGNPGSGWTDIA